MLIYVMLLGVLVLRIPDADVSAHIVTLPDIKIIYFAAWLSCKPLQFSLLGISFSFRVWS